jgi:CysZ protein
MAVPLSIPLINLLIPVLGAATFTHLYHRLAGTGR